MAPSSIKPQLNWTQIIRKITRSVSVRMNGFVFKVTDTESLSQYVRQN